MARSIIGLFLHHLELLHSRHSIRHRPLPIHNPSATSTMGVANTQGVPQEKTTKGSSASAPRKVKFNVGK